jgi:hypothetical protein
MHYCRGFFLLFLATLELACGPGEPEAEGDASTTDASPTTLFEPTSASFGSSPDGSTGGSASAAATGSVTSGEPDPSGPSGDSSGVTMGSATEPPPDTTDPDPSTTGGEEFTCETYCAIYLGGCASPGEYEGEEDCLDQCAQWPIGEPGALTGDSLHCRANHASMASMSDVMHCAFAGPSGGGVCVDPNAPTCADYCSLYFANCTGGLNLYADIDDCLVQCAGWYPGLENDTTSDSVACRTYHADVAGGDDVVHCPHAGPDGGHVCVTH